MAVTEKGSDKREVTVHLSFDPRTDAMKLMAQRGDENKEIENGLTETMAKINSLYEKQS